MIPRRSLLRRPRPSRSRSFRSTLISRGGTLEQLAAELRSDGPEIEAVAADIDDLDGYRATLDTAT